MAVSKCAKCDGTKFEAVKAEPANSPQPLLLVQCAQCGVVVGVLTAPIEMM